MWCCPFFYGLSDGVQEVYLLYGFGAVEVHFVVCRIGVYTYGCAVVVVLQGCGYGIYGDVQGVAGYADDGGVAIGICDECAGNRVAIQQGAIGIGGAVCANGYAVFVPLEAIGPLCNDGECYRCTCCDDGIGCGIGEGEIWSVFYRIRK